MIIAATVFPTDVGMNRDTKQFFEAIRRVPHGRGDEPVFGHMKAISIQCSPRTWG